MASEAMDIPGCQRVPPKLLASHKERTCLYAGGARLALLGPDESVSLLKGPPASTT